MTGLDYIPPSIYGVSKGGCEVRTSERRTLWDAAGSSINVKYVGCIQYRIYLPEKDNYQFCEGGELEGRWFVTTHVIARRVVHVAHTRGRRFRLWLSDIAIAARPLPNRSLSAHEHCVHTRCTPTCQRALF